jgi:O-methyltransferase
MGIADLFRRRPGPEPAPIPIPAPIPAPAPTDFDVFARAVTPMKTSYRDLTEGEQQIYRQSNLNLNGGPEAVTSLVRSVQYVIRNNVPGVFVECGVYMGGNIEVMIRALQTFGAYDRDIWLYDTFAGMPKPGTEDTNGPDGVPLTNWSRFSNVADGDRGSDWMRAGTDIVQQRLAPLGYPQDHLYFVEGLVEETIPQHLPEQIAILRLDTDFYSSTKHELKHMYPRLVSGGILIIDDYGAFDGCRRAVDEYAAEHGMRWFLNRIDAHVRLVVKP